jgi:hypothetical protein
VAKRGRVKVLYIAGYGRSGTTILANALGELDGFLNIGEARYVWNRGLIGNWYCGCGDRFRDCEFWNEVFEGAFGGLDSVDPQDMIPYLAPWSRALRSWKDRMVASYKRLEDRPFTDFLRRLEALYRSVSEVAGCDVIVDESKWPDYAYMLTLVPSVDLRILHVHRDPRGVANSWKKPRKFEPDPASDIHTPVHNPVRTALEWVVWNTAVRKYSALAKVPYMQVAHEGFVANPEETLSSILHFAGCEKAVLPLINRHELLLGGNHAVSGHPVRFTRGRVRLELDESWQTEMSWLERSIVWALTWPLMKAENLVGSRRQVDRRWVTERGDTQAESPGGYVEGAPRARESRQGP